MSTSKPPKPPGGGNGNGNGNGSSNPYARFIPREELKGFEAWNPQPFEVPQPSDAAKDAGVRKPSFAERVADSTPPFQNAPGAPRPASGPIPVARPAGRPQPQPAAPKGATVTPLRRPIVGGVPGEDPRLDPDPVAQPAAEPAPNIDELVDVARREGYQDGYRNGLSALETYKQTQGAQLAAHMSDQVAGLVSDLHRRLESLEQQLAGRISGVALELARQVVRSEIHQRPEQVLMVAEEALGTLLASARQIVLRMHPDDQAMAQGTLTEILDARGARLVPDLSITRGGCVVESDIAVVDASVEARWSRAAAVMGSDAEWNEGHEMPYRAKPLPEDDEFVGGLGDAGEDRP